MSAKDMSRIYRGWSDQHLRERRSIKVNKLAALQRSLSYMDAAERRRLEYNLKQIDAELACRAAQTRLFDL